MKNLRDILYKVNITAVKGDLDLNIHGISFDSRRIQSGFVFVAMTGSLTDGRDYIDNAIKAGAVAIITETLPAITLDHVVYITVKSSHHAMGVLAANFFDNPSEKLKLIGVTGTNGKTSVATLLYQLFSALGYKVGLISTVVNKICDRTLQAERTTPDAIQLNELLVEMVNSGCTYCFIEVSSHAVVQGRIAGLKFAVGLFTNITHDHLDYHQTFNNYIQAKKSFFDLLGSDAFAIINADDKRGSVMVQNCRAKKVTVAMKSMADYRVKVITNSIDGLELEIEQQTAWFKLIGEYNALNLILVYACAICLEQDAQEVLTVLTGLSGAPGRMERVMPGSRFTIIVDYAHSPDALLNVLETINHFNLGDVQIISVVGCGGGRDKTKRPLMASIACKHSSKVILTSDNPRDEDPLEIIKEMQAGVGPSQLAKTLVMADREEAIKTACMMAKENDVVLVAGKGHESYQEIRGVRHPFDDREVAIRMLKLFNN